MATIEKLPKIDPYIFLLTGLVAIFVFAATCGNAQKDIIIYNPQWYFEDGKLYKKPEEKKENEIQALTLMGWGSAIDKILGLMAADDYEAIKEIRAKIKNVKFNKILVNRLKAIRRDYADDEINDFEYVYAKASLLQLSMAELETLEGKAYQLGLMYIQMLKPKIE